MALCATFAIPKMNSVSALHFFNLTHEHQLWTAPLGRLFKRASTMGVRCLLCCLSSLFVVASNGHAAVVHLAVASNFAKPIQVLAADFEASHAHQVQVSLGSTGKLFAQIQHGAPFDVLMAADQRRPALLEQKGQVVPGSRRTYATGRLVLWSADPQRLTQSKAADSWPSDADRLAESERGAIANPKLAPYGAAAEQVLQRAGVWDNWRTRLVTGENIAQTNQFVATGNAAMGLVARSQVMEGDRIVSGSGWPVPETWHAPIAQDIALLSRAQDNPAAIAWMRYISSPRAAALIRAAGYGMGNASDRRVP